MQNQYKEAVKIGDILFVGLLHVLKDNPNKDRGECSLLFLSYLILSNLIYFVLRISQPCESRIKLVLYSKFVQRSQFQENRSLCVNPIKGHVSDSQLNAGSVIMTQ